MTIFARDNIYKEKVSNYTKKDGIKAIIIYCILLIIYTLSGAASANRLFSYSYFYSVFDIAVLALCLLVLYLSRESINTIGITKLNLKKSLFLGGYLSIIFIVINIVTSLHYGCEINNLLKYLINIIALAVSEEFVFRGFIQTRIYGLIKNRYIAISVVGTMYVLAQFPALMILFGDRFLDYISVKIFWLISLFVLHIVSNFVYEKYNCLSGSILLNCLLRFSKNIII